MNNPIRWDASLVKKFSSANHYKLLNQLRNEVKKYPLNNKKKTIQIQDKETIKGNKNKSNMSHTPSSSLSNNPYHTNASDTNKSTVSFNNAKNFSIYNQSINSNNRQNEDLITDQAKAKDVSTASSFQERLNQIDLK